MSWRNSDFLGRSTAQIIGWMLSKEKERKTEDNIYHVNHKFDYYQDIIANVAIVSFNHLSLLGREKNSIFFVLFWYFFFLF